MLKPLFYNGNKAIIKLFYIFYYSVNNLIMIIEVKLVILNKVKDLLLQDMNVSYQA